MIEPDVLPFFPLRIKRNEEGSLHTKALDAAAARQDLFTGEVDLQKSFAIMA